MIAVLLALLAMGPAQQASAPNGRDARVAVTVVDQTGAIVQNATVTVTSLDVAKNTLAPVKTNDKGIASLAGLAPGRYKIEAEFPGFEVRVLPDVRLKSGDNKHVAVLAIQGLQDSVTVSRDKQEAAADRRATFGTALTREQIDSLSDDPDEMAQQLQDMAGGNGVIRVDSFEGGRLPPKTAIKAIHITRDAFAAENHYAGGLFIDIITQPGIGPLRTNMNTRLRDGSLSGKPPTDISTDRKGPERMQSYNGGIGGSIIKQKASFSVNVNSNLSFDTPYFNYTDSICWSAAIRTRTGTIRFASRKPGRSGAGSSRTHGRPSTGRIRTLIPSSRLRRSWCSTRSPLADASREADRGRNP